MRDRKPGVGPAPLIAALVGFCIVAFLVAHLAARLVFGAPLNASRPVDSHPVDREVPVGGAPISALESGTATYCAPTPRYCQSWGGDAMLGAVASFSYGDRPYRVEVCNTDNGRCTSVTIVSFCACGPTLIDLSPAAFLALEPRGLHIGRIPVTVRTGAQATLPPTDSEGEP